MLSAHTSILEASPRMESEAFAEFVDRSTRILARRTSDPLGILRILRIHLHPRAIGRGLEIFVALLFRHQ